MAPSDHLHDAHPHPRPIGMLDSGVGGLSVLRDVRALLPNEDIIYVADEGHLPYGVRPREELQTFVEGIARFLQDRGCKLLVIACNTANAAALHYLRGVFPTWPIVGMEPAIKPAAEHTKSGVIGVIMTKATFQSDLYASVVDRFAQRVQVEARACPDLVLLVEAGIPDTAESRRIVAENLAPFKAAGADQLVLGCTHFPFLNPLIQEYLGPDVTIIDPAPAVARQVRRVLESRGELNQSPHPGQIEYLTTGSVAHFAGLLATLMGDTQSPVKQATWQGRQLRADS